MEIAEILNQVNIIFIDILDEVSIVLTNATMAEDVEEWDSLTHIQLIVAIEKHFKIRFNSAEIRNWKNVGELCNSIKVKL